MLMKKDRGKVWLGVAAIVEDSAGEWLLVKKTYGGLKGAWSLPAGFVRPAETVTNAVTREVLEETGIVCEVKGLVGFRSGVILNDISDNMAIFYCKPVDNDHHLLCRKEKSVKHAGWHQMRLSIMNCHRSCSEKWLTGMQHNIFTRLLKV